MSLHLIGSGGVICPISDQSLESGGDYIYWLKLILAQAGEGAFSLKQNMDTVTRNGRIDDGCKKKKSVHNKLLILCLSFLRFLREILLENYSWFPLKFQQVANDWPCLQSHIWRGGVCSPCWTWCHTHSKLSGAGSLCGTERTNLYNTPWEKLWLRV